jgi:glycosyltransferase involved in cell wall biosynthesis
VNGIWQYHSVATWRALRDLKIPYFVFTHGMLDPWFKSKYPMKHLKKILYWYCAEKKVLRDARAVLFTSEDERRLARMSFKPYDVTEEVVAYGTSSPPDDAHRLKEILLFLSRIHEKKGCDLLIEAFANVAYLDPTLHLVIAGPDRSGLSVDLRNRAQCLGIEKRVSWPGMIRGDMKWGAFHASQAFILPSHQENFGIAVAEALACGKPVLISDKVNIWREIEARDAGFVASDTIDGTEKNIRRFFSLNETERDKMGTCARELFCSRFTVDAMALDLIRVLKKHGASGGRSSDGR